MNPENSSTIAIEDDAEPIDWTGYAEPQFSGRSACSRNWEGFKKSTEAVDKKRRYNAKCKWCYIVILGLPDKLKAHKLICKKMPEIIAAQIEVDLNEPGPSKIRKISTLFPKVIIDQENADETLAKAIILGDIPFR